MKTFTTAAVLATCVALLSHSVAAFFGPKKMNPVPAAVEAVPKKMNPVPAAVEAVPDTSSVPILSSFNPLRLLLAVLGVPVEPLVEGTQKCVRELGPEALGAVTALRKLLGLLTYIG